MAELLAPIVPVITGVPLTSSGLVPAITSTGNKFFNNGTQKLIVKNGSGTTRTITIDAPGTCNFGVAANAIHDAVVTVLTLDDAIVGPFDTVRFNDANNYVWVFVDVVTDVDLGVI
jgi:hypothetical protein